MMAVSDSEKVEILGEVLEKMDECARLLRSLGDARIEAYCLAEGREGGWLGHFVRDVLEEELQAARDGGEDDE